MKNNSLSVNLEIPLCGIEEQIFEDLFLVIRKPNFLATTVYDSKIMLPCFESEFLANQHIEKEYSKDQVNLYFLVKVDFDHARQLAKDLKQTVALLIYQKENHIIHYVK